MPSVKPADLLWPASTARLAIRPAVVEDLPRIFEYYRKPEVSEWLASHPADLDAFIERARQPELLACIYVVERGDIHIGDLYMGIRDAWAQKEVQAQAHATQAEIGYVIAPDYAGQGYANEAVAELLRICFEDLGLRRVTAECLAENVASWRVMEKAGMRRETVTRQASLHRSGRWLDGYGYAVLADEWCGSRVS
nr:GNAT family N-acetyltransferase [Arthrobacter gengyunqii]